MAMPAMTVDKSVCDMMPQFARADAELMVDVVQILRYRSDIPGEVLVTTADGVVTLSGRVAWAYQKDAAQATAESVHGVREVRNHIEIISSVSAYDVRARILEAFRRKARRNTSSVYVRAEGRTVIISGHVPSEVEKNDAARAAWRTPGVAEVRNQLAIGD